jgi:predicted phage terminase large subunit-like protein
VVVLPQDPGQAGVDQVGAFVRELAGFTVRPRRPSAAKVVRAGPWSSQVGARNAALVRAPWVASFIAQHHAFPEGPHDDKVDAAADAFAELAGTHEAPSYSDAAAALGAVQRRDTARASAWDDPEDDD